MSLVLVNVALLIELEESPLFGQIGLERSLFVGNLGLCTPPKILASSVPVYNEQKTVPKRNILLEMAGNSFARCITSCFAMGGGG